MGSECNQCPVSLFKSDNLKMISLFSAGLLAGQSYGLNIYTLPLLKNTKDPQERKQLFKKLYKSSNRTIISTSLLYYNTKNNSYLSPLSLTLLKFFVDFGVLNTKYKNDIENFEGNDENKMNQLTDGFRFWHWFRVSTDMCAFVALICTALYHRKN